MIKGRISNPRRRSARRALSGLGVGDTGEGVKVALVCIRQCVEVFLSRLDLGVPHAVHDGLEIGAASQQPGGVGVAEVVDAEVEVETC
jgi:hypothetical protein